MFDVGEARDYGAIGASRFRRLFKLRLLEFFVFGYISIARHRIVAGSFKLSHEQVFEVAPDAGLPTYPNHYDPFKGKRSVSGVAPLTDNLFRSGAAGECD